jgi:hypothetical protein
VIGTSAAERVAETPTPVPGGPAEGTVPGDGPTTGTGPEVPGPAAFGLCTAHGAGELNPQSPAHRALADAAGGEAGIEEFCAEVERPGPSPGVPADVPEDRERAPGAPGAPPPEAPSAAPADGRPADHAVDPSAPVPTGPPGDTGPAPEAGTAPPGGFAPGAGPDDPPTPSTS